MLKGDRVSSVKIVDTFILRIEQVGKMDIGPEMCGHMYHHLPLPQINPLTNCVVDARFEGAREDARSIDAEIAVALSEGSVDSLFAQKPLLGIPFTAKDCFNVKGLSWEDCYMTSLITCCVKATLAVLHQPMDLFKSKI